MDMSDPDEDDKPTVVLDLNALKKQALKQEEDLANISQELEFAVDSEKVEDPAPKEVRRPPGKEAIQKPAMMPAKKKFSVILFDLQSTFFKEAMKSFPEGYDYKLTTTLPELNNLLKNKDFQIVLFNYDSNPKAVNTLSAQIKQKFPTTKVLIVAKAISPEKARLHAATPAGASGYYQLPLDTQKLQNEFERIYSTVKKVS